MKLPGNARIHDVTYNNSTDTAQRGTTRTAGIISGDRERGKKRNNEVITQKSADGNRDAFSDGNHTLLRKQQEITINVR